MEIQVIGQGGQTNLNVIKPNMEVNNVEKEFNTNSEDENRYTKENLNKAIKKLNGF